MKNLAVCPEVLEYVQKAKVANPLTLSYRPLYSAPDDTLKIIYNNAHSHKKQFHDVICNYNILTADIIWMSEARLKSVDTTEHYTMKDFKIYRQDQPKTQTPYHGLMLYIHISIEVHHIRKYSGCKLEVIDVIISKNKVQFNVIGIYKSPMASTVELLHYMDIIIQNTSQLALVIIADFNLDVTHNSSKSFCDVMKTKYSCDQHVPQSTTDEQTTIDLIFSNHSHQIPAAIVCYWSDHKLLYTVIDLTVAAQIQYQVTIIYH